MYVGYCVARFAHEPFEAELGREPLRLYQIEYNVCEEEPERERGRYDDVEAYTDVRLRGVEKKERAQREAEH